MACEMHFSKNGGGRQGLFEYFALWVKYPRQNPLAKAIR
jgi:hypothetical protein